MSHLASSRRFLATLMLIAVAALGIRVAFVLGVARHDHHFYDAAYYELQADRVARGHGYTDPFLPITSPRSPPMPSAQHPPLTVFVLTPVAWVTGDSQLAMRFTFAVLGVVTVVLIGLLGREIAGGRAGLIAAGIAAVYPYLWVNDGLIMSETVTALTVVSALLLTYRLVRRPRLLTAAALGVVCGLAALARVEVVLLAPLLAGWLLASHRLPSLRLRLGSAGLVVGAAALVVAPWFAYNLSRFQDFTFISTNDGVALLGSNCDPVYYGSGIGLTNVTPGQCLPLHPPPGDESVSARDYRDRAFGYIGDHKKRFILVTAARVGRDWSLYRPLDMLAFNRNEGRPPWVTALGLGFYYPLLALAVAGAVVLWRRRAAVWPLLVPPIIVTVSAVASYGQTRFRVEAEPCLVVLGAVAVSAAVDAIRDRREPHRTAEVESSPLDPRPDLQVG